MIAEGRNTYINNISFYLPWVQPSYQYMGSAKGQWLPHVDVGDDDGGGGVDEDGDDEDGLKIHENTK